MPESEYPWRLHRCKRSLTRIEEGMKRDRSESEIEVPRARL